MRRLKRLAMLLAFVGQTLYLAPTSTNATTVARYASIFGFTCRSADKWHVSIMNVSAGGVLVLSTIPGIKPMLVDKTDIFEKPFGVPYDGRWWACFRTMFNLPQFPPILFRPAHTT